MNSYEQAEIINDDFSLKVASLGSGSKGNSTLIASQQSLLAIDCGFTLKEFLIRLEKFEVSPEAIDAILVTHEHQDHIKGAGALSRKYAIPVYATRGTELSEKLGKIKDFNRVVSKESFEIKDIRVEPFLVPHDAREPCQFSFHSNQKKLSLLSDLGSITDTVIHALNHSHALLLEMNHDRDMLQQGVYPDYLKRRVGGDFGHLNNEQSLALLNRLNLDSLELLVATHLSEENNSTDLVLSELSAFLERANLSDTVQSLVACQQKGLNWFKI